MQRLFAQFPYSDDPRRFAAVLGVALAIVVSASGFGLTALPLPRLPQDPLPAGALIAISVPAASPFAVGAAVLKDVLPEESAALARFSQNFPDIAAALSGDGNALLTVFAVSASGTPRFLLELPPAAQEEPLLSALAKTVPSVRRMRLPDGTEAQELIKDRAALSAQLNRLPGTDWLLLEMEGGTIAYREDERAFIFSSFNPQELLWSGTRGTLSRPFCLRGAPAVLPGLLSHRWVRIPFGLSPLGMVIPVSVVDARIANHVFSLKNFCFHL